MTKLHFEDLTQITCPFGMLDDDTQKRLRACEEVLFYNCFGEWVKILEPSWADATIYRAKPKPKRVN